MHSVRVMNRLLTNPVPLIGLNHIAHIANMSNGNVKDDGPFETAKTVGNDVWN